MDKEKMSITQNGKGCLWLSLCRKKELLKKIQNLKFNLLL